MNVTSDLAIGVDAGATKIEAALVTRLGEVIATQRKPTVPDDGPDAVIDNLTAAIVDLLHQSPKDVAGVGIGIPGVVDPIAGIVHNAVNLGWRDVPLAAEIRERLGTDVPIHIHRDANAEIMGEAYFGAGQGCRNLIYLGIGSGLGGAALVNDQLVIGDTFSASEIGHLSLDPDGRLCNCGIRGCAETVISGPGLLAVTLDYLSQHRYPTALSASPELTPTAIVEAAYTGDLLAQAVFDRVTQWLGTIIAAYATILNPSRVVIGGGLGRAAFELLLPKTQAEIERRVLDANYKKLQIVQSQLVSSAVGASCLVWQGSRFSGPGKA